MRSSRNYPREEEPQEEWIWGNHRGGGGAPLKTVDGSNATNLRAVLRGSQQIDVSPKKYAQNTSYSEDDDENYHRPVKGLENVADRHHDSPKRVKSTLREVNITNGEREEKAR
jgi:hypothetical protein